MEVPIPADFEITVTLQAQEWGVIMDVLYDGRHRIVWPIIQKLTRQFEQTPAPQQMQPSLPLRNGEDHARAEPRSVVG